MVAKFFYTLTLLLSISLSNAQSFTKDFNEFKEVLKKELKKLDADKHCLVAFSYKTKGYSYFIEDLDEHFDKDNFEALRPIDKMVTDISLRLSFGVDMDYKIFKYPVEINGKKVDFYDYREVYTHKKDF